MNRTVAGTTGYHDLPLARLMESRHNPRRRFNEKSLAELAASIEEHGILTPILVRPQDGDYEIAAGHRRYRAARIAGFVTIPAVVRDMNDQQFMEVLTVENLQREDVHAYEEAQGYAELLKMPGYNVEALAGKIGRSESYVHSRLKLTKLIPEVADAFLEDRITFAHARLIAPLPAEKQEEALKECFETWGEHKLLPPSDLRQWIRDGDGESLSDAPFDLDDIGLLPSAGPCMACPKSTCAEGKLFADDRGEETCYDKKCFELKIEAQVRLHTKAGLVAIDTSWDGKKAPAGALLREEFTEIEVPTDIEEDEEPNPNEQDCKFSENAVIVVGGQKGKTALICRNPKCPIHGKAHVEKAAQSSSGKPSNDAYYDKQRDAYSKQQNAEKQKRDAEWVKRQATVDQIVANWHPEIDRTFALLLFINELNGIYGSDDLKKICDEFLLDEQGDDAATKAVIYTWAERTSTLNLIALLKRFLLQDEVQRYAHSKDYDLIEIAAGELKDQIGPVKAAKPTKKKAK